MSVPLPPSLITEIKSLLLPYVHNEDERDALLTETFFLRDPRPLNQINLTGSPEVFSTRCIATLINKIGCLALEGDTQHSLSALLSTIRARCGAEKHDEIDKWVSVLNDQCESLAIETQPVKAITAQPQTPNTLQAERIASVFISYSHTDETFANQLIASLQAAGHQCWIDTSEIKGGSDWQRSICDGINLSYALVVVCTRTALESEYVWDEIQWARTRRKLIIPVLLEDITGSDRFFGLHRFQGIRFDKLPYPQAEAELIAALPPALHIDPTMPPRIPTRREYELAYLDRLRFNDFRLEKFELAEYVALGGIAHEHREIRNAWDILAMKQEFALIRVVKQDNAEIEASAEPFTDAMSKITELRRTVVLGEPGAGKTHTLRAVAKPLYTAALTDPDAPIPLMIKLGNWDDPEQSFEAFLRRALDELGVYLDDLLANNRAVLLLDGLNEFPADQRTAKYPQVENFIEKHPVVMAVVTCREADYPISLNLHKILIRPLDSTRILDFARRILRTYSETEGDIFFWKLAGSEKLEAVWQKWEAAGADFALFWNAAGIPHENPYMYYKLSRDERDLWIEYVRSPRSMMQLASNPYMLRMLIDVYIQYHGVLPTNRGQLFEQFITVLLQREKLADIDDNAHVVTLTQDGKALLTSLERIAYQMQVRRASRTKSGDLSAGTALDLTAARDILGERLLYLAVSTSILNTGTEVRFSHQLLQEYFAARYMDGEIRAGRLKAADIWQPERWWERTNWEEAAVLLAGLYSDDATPVLDWLADANPEVAALCIARSGATTPDTTKIRLRDRWLPRLINLQADPTPHALAATGRALGLVTISDLPADNRKGVSLVIRGGIKLPDFDWIKIPGGEFIYGDDNKDFYPNSMPPADHQIMSLPPFSISRCPVTYAQYQTFIDDREGFADPRWWDGLADNKYRRDNQSAPGEQVFKFWNHPCENVSWYDAIAFCRWLSWRMVGGHNLDNVGAWAVRLPTEHEWEKAARGEQGLIYPYGNVFDATKANTRETGIRQTSAVGIFPDGASPHGVMDVSGNVWEWCITNSSKPQTSAAAENLHTSTRRVLRGGSWDDSQYVGRAAFRDNHGPNVRYLTFGFRVVCSSPIS